MREDQRRAIIREHMPWPERATVALEQFVACFPSNVRVTVTVPVIETTTLGESMPQGLRGMTTVATQRAVGFVDKPSYDAVDWELGPRALRPVRVVEDAAL